LPADAVGDELDHIEDEEDDEQGWPGIVLRMLVD